MIIALEGNIAAGKTGFSEALYDFLKSKDLDVILIKEPIEEWRDVKGFNLLRLFYFDQERWGLPFQIKALLSMIENEKRAIEESEKGRIVIMERSTFSVTNIFGYYLTETFCIEPLELDLLEELKKSVLNNNIYDDDRNLVVYLQTDPRVCFERLKKRMREEEMQKVDLTYLNDLHRIHRENILKDKSIKNLVTVDGNRCEQSLIYSAILIEPNTRNELFVEFLMDFIKVKNNKTTDD